MAKDSAPVPLDTPAVRILHAINRIGARMYHRLDVLTPCQLPAHGRAIVICNHTSGLDPHLIQSCCNRVLIWMMAREYYEKPILKPLLDTIGVIPIARNGRDSAGTRAALRALEHDHMLGIFPEGKIETTREFLPFQTGVALLAIKTKSPVYPVYLDGTQRGKEMVQAFARPQRATIAFGPEVHFDRTDTSREGLETATAAMRDAIAALRDGAANLRWGRGL